MNLDFVDLFQFLFEFFPACGHFDLAFLRRLENAPLVQFLLELFTEDCLALLKFNFELCGLFVVFGSYLVQFVSIVGLDKIVLWLVSADDRLPFALVLGGLVGSDPTTALVLKHRLHGLDLV